MYLQTILSGIHNTAYNEKSTLYNISSPYIRQSPAFHRPTLKETVVSRLNMDVCMNREFVYIYK